MKRFRFVAMALVLAGCQPASAQDPQEERVSKVISLLGKVDQRIDRLEDRVKGLSGGQSPPARPASGSASVYLTSYSRGSGKSAYGSAGSPPSPGTMPMFPFGPGSVPPPFFLAGPPMHRGRHCGGQVVVIHGGPPPGFGRFPPFPPPPPFR